MMRPQITREDLTDIQLLLELSENPKHQEIGKRVAEQIKVADNSDEKSQAFLKAARDNHGRDGELEFDDNAVVSASEEGAYVMGWTWITNEEAGE